MENSRDVLVLSGTRTAIGKFGGGLGTVPPCDLAATVTREAVSRAGRRWCWRTGSSPSVTSTARSDALYELHRTGGRYALVTMCTGGGQGIAAIFEKA